MDPELKALLRGMKPGSREYQATVNKYMAERASREGAAADRAARLEQEAQNAAAQRDAERARRDEDFRRAQAAEQEARDQRTSMVGAGAAATGLGAGVGTAKYADRVANQRADAVLTGRATEVRNAAQSARAVNPNSAAAPGQYADIARGARRTGAMSPRVLPVGTAGIGLSALGLGAYSTFGRAPEAKSDIERAVWTGTGYGEMSAGAKMLWDSARRYRNPGVTLPAADVAAIEGAERMGAGGKVGPVAPPANADPYSVSTKPAAPAPSNTVDLTRLRELRQKKAAELRADAKALGLPTSGLKDDLARRIAEHGGAAAPVASNSPVAGFLNESLKRGTDATTTVDDAYAAYVKHAEAAGSKPVPMRAFIREMTANGVQMGRIAGANRFLVALKDVGKSSVLLPVAAGALAYDAVSGDAEAAGADAMTATGQGAAAGGAAAGTVYGASKLAPYALDAARKSPLGRAALRAIPVVGGALTAYDIGNYVAQSATPAPENDAFAEQYGKTHPQSDPDAMLMERARARQAIRSPMRSASALELPNVRPGAAVTADRQGAMNSDDFEAQLQAFVQAVQDHNAGIGEAYGP